MSSFNSDSCRRSFKKALGYTGKDQFAQTPDSLYNNLNKEFHFTFDPCPVNPNFDGLSIPWKDSNYVNPPYKNLKLWFQKAIVELPKKSVFLVPFRPDTSYFRDLVFVHASEIRILHKRMRFKNYDKAVAFCMCLIVFGHHELSHDPLITYHSSKFHLYKCPHMTTADMMTDLIPFFDVVYQKEQEVSTFMKMKPTEISDRRVMVSTGNCKDAVAKALSICKRNKQCSIVLFIPLRLETKYLQSAIDEKLVQAVVFVDRRMKHDNHLKTNIIGNIFLVISHTSIFPIDQLPFSSLSHCNISLWNNSDVSK